MTEELKPVRTEGFARECREIADALKVEYGQRRNRNGMPYLDFERHPYVGRAGALLRQATAIVAELEALRVTPAPAQPEGQEDEPVAYWIPKAEQFCLASKDGSRPFAKAWEPLYLHPSRSAGAAAPAEGAAWQPIETAPRDGTHVLVCWPRRLLDDEDFPSGEIVAHATAVSFCSGGYWVEPDYLDAIGASFDDDDAYAPEPTHWMPLPAAPKEKP